MSASFPQILAYLQDFRVPLANKGLDGKHQTSLCQQHLLPLTLACLQCSSAIEFCADCSHLHSLVNPHLSLSQLLSRTINQWEKQLEEEQKLQKIWRTVKQNLQYCHWIFGQLIKRGWKQWKMLGKGQADNQSQIDQDNNSIDDNGQQSNQMESHYFSESTWQVEKKLTNIFNTLTKSSNVYDIWKQLDSKGKEKSNQKHKQAQKYNHQKSPLTERSLASIKAKTIQQSNRPNSQSNKILTSMKGFSEKVLALCEDIAGMVGKGKKGTTLLKKDRNIEKQISSHYRIKEKGRDPNQNSNQNYQDASHFSTSELVRPGYSLSPKSLLSYIDEQPMIQSLHVHNSKPFSYHPSSWPSLFSSIQQLHSLKSLHLTMRVKDVAAIVSFLRRREQALRGVKQLWLMVVEDSHSERASSQEDSQQGSEGAPPALDNELSGKQYDPATVAQSSSYWKFSLSPAIPLLLEFINSLELSAVDLMLPLQYLSTADLAALLTSVRYQTSLSHIPMKKFVLDIRSNRQANGQQLTQVLSKKAISVKTRQVISTK